MKHILEFRLFEYKAGPKIKIKWTENDAIITLYYEKFGLRKLGVTNDNVEAFVNEYIGSTENSLKMQAACIRYLLTLNNAGVPSGLPNYSNIQEEIVEKYRKFSEPELREVVQDILDNMTDDEKLNNLIMADEYKKEEVRKGNQKKQETLPKLEEPRDKFGRVMKKVSDIKATPPFQIGENIIHRKLGPGKVLSINGNILEVDFRTGGVKKIAYIPELFL